MSRTGGTLVQGLLGLCVAACDGRPPDEAFANAVREAGLACESVVQVAALDAAETRWRVACRGAETYIAYVEAEALCVEPLPLGDAIVPAPIGEVEPRCTAL